MLPSALVARFRTDTGDLEDPPLWRDDEIWEYLVDAQRMFCRLTGGLQDASTAWITDAALTADSPWVPVSQLVLSIRSARLVSTGRSVKVVSYEELFTNPSGPADDYHLPSSTSELDLSGSVTTVVIGMEEHRLRAVRIPEEDDTLRLVVKRLPKRTPRAATPARTTATPTSLSQVEGIATLVTSAAHGLSPEDSVTVAGADQAAYNATHTILTTPTTTSLTFAVASATATPATGTLLWNAAAMSEVPFEISEQHHIHLLNWMEALAFRKMDVDTFDKARAEEKELTFRAYCSDVNRERAQRDHKPRLMAYGGL
jgi:hypothetical protein